MIHYSCDRCKQIIDPDTEVRYIVRLEIQATVDSEVQHDFDHDHLDDHDHLTALQEVLERVEQEEGEDLSGDVYQSRRFDLCHDCYRQYINNPLAIDAPVLVSFSDN